MRFLFSCIVAICLTSCKSSTSNSSTTTLPESTAVVPTAHDSSDSSRTTLLPTVSPDPDKGSPTLVAALTEAQKVLSASDAEIADEYNPVVNSLLASKRGSRDMRRYEGLGVDAHLLLPTMQSILDSAGAAADECMYVLEYMVDRPDWFYFARSSVQRLRACAIALVEGSDKLLVEGPFVDAIKTLLNLIYSPVTEVLLRSNEPVPEGPGDFKLFRATLLALTGSADGIRGTITTAIQTATPDEWMASLNPTDRLFIQRLIETNFAHPSLPYLVEFMDARGLPLFLVKLVLNSLPQFDDMELNHVVNDIRIWSPSTYWDSVAYISSDGGGINQNYGNWYDAIGQFLESLWATNRVDPDRLATFKTCLTPEFFETTTEIDDGTLDDPGSIHYVYYYLKYRAGSITMYQCFADALLEGTLVVPSGLPSEIWAQKIVYLYRRLSSVPAFLLKS